MYKPTHTHTQKLLTPKLLLFRGAIYRERRTHRCTRFVLVSPVVCLCKYFFFLYLYVMARSYRKLIYYYDINIQHNLLRNKIRTKRKEKQTKITIRFISDSAQHLLLEEKKKQKQNGMKLSSP